MKIHAHLAAAALALLPLGAGAADAPAAEAPAKPVKLVYRTVPPEAQESPLDVNKATRAYLNLLSGPERAKSDAYFEGDYWLQLLGFLYGLGAAVLLLQTRLSSRMRSLAERAVPSEWLRPHADHLGKDGRLFHLEARLLYGLLRGLQASFYAVQWLIVVTVLTFPLDVYRGYFREHEYGLSNLTFGGWMTEQGKGLFLGSLIAAGGMGVLYMVLRKVGRAWWLWGAGVALAFVTVIIVIGPVFLAPVFNDYRPVQDPTIREAVLRLARANDIPTNDVYEFDASRQSDRVSANVSGFLGTMRISLNDNLLERANQAQIEAVMAHEMGHYVLNHVFKSLLFFAVFLPLSFAFARWGVGKLLASRGARWEVRGVDDPAGWPLLLAVLSAFMFLATPVLNSFIRSQEQEADQFALNAAAQPDAQAQVDLALGEYRKLDPGHLEEVLFFDHPSGRVRIQTAMKWKAEHLEQLRCRQSQAPAAPSATPAPP